GSPPFGRAVAEEPGWRANQLVDLGIRLLLSAGDLQQVLGRAVKDFRERFGGSSLTRARGTEQKEDARGPVRGVETCLVHLDVGNDVLKGARLTDYFARKQFDQIGRLLRRVQRSSRIGVHDPEPPRPALYLSPAG